MASYSEQFIFSKETWDNERMMLPKDVENSMDGACGQQGSLKENVRKKDI